MKQVLCGMTFLLLFPFCSSKPTEEACEGACENALTVVKVKVREKISALPPEALSNFESEAKKQSAKLKSSCIESCMENGSKEAVECVARASDYPSLEECITKYSKEKKKKGEEEEEGEEE